MESIADRNVDIEELTLDIDDIFTPAVDGDAVILKGVTLELEMDFIRGFCCCDDGDIPLVIEVEGEYTTLGMFKLQLDNILNLVSVSDSYKLFLQLDKKLIDLTLGENLLRLIEI